MKKLFCSVLVLLVFLSSVPCVSSAMTEDEYKQQIRAMFADATDEDLKSLFEAVQYELMCRGYKFDFDESHQAASAEKEATEQKEVTVPAGSYTIGSDIPAGTYTIVAAPSAVMSMITVYGPSGGMDTVQTVSGDTHIGKIELKDGQRIEIVGSSVIFKPYAGLGF